DRLSIRESETSVKISKNESMRYRPPSKAGDGPIWRSGALEVKEIARPSKLMDGASLPTINAGVEPAAIAVLALFSLSGVILRVGGCIASRSEAPWVSGTRASEETSASVQNKAQLASGLNLRPA